MNATEAKDCTCSLPSFGEIDGDRRVIYCNKCLGVIGIVDEQYIIPKHCKHLDTHDEHVEAWTEDNNHIIEVCNHCGDILGERI